MSQHQARNMDAGEMPLAGKDRGGVKYGYGISVTKAIADKSVGYSCVGHPGGVGAVGRNYDVFVGGGCRSCRRT